MSDLPHLRLEDTAQVVGYTFAGGGRGGLFQLPPRDRRPHAEKLKRDLAVAEADARTRLEREGGESEGDVVAVRSDRGFPLRVESLERLKSGIELLSVRMENGVTVGKVFVPRGKYGRLLALIDAYNEKETRGGHPRNQKLIESIAAISLAAVQDFWEDEAAFPREEESLWWEVWLRRRPDEPGDAVHSRFRELARTLDIQVSDRHVAFPERVVTLAQGTQRQFASSVQLLSLLAELRKAKDLATRFVDLPAREQRGVVEGLLARLTGPRAIAPAVCLLDTGVHREHPLLEPALMPEDCQTINQAWGIGDDSRVHGTEMAGIALYGSLTEVFSSGTPVVLGHRLESVKILPPPPGQNSPRDYGAFTAQAVSLAEVRAPRRNRAICMAVSADDRDLGMPSLWSAAVDQLCAGALDDGRRLFFLAAGNVERTDLQSGPPYPRLNCEQKAIEDPGQSWNAVTVGAYTEKVVIQDPGFRGWNPVAPKGDLTPTSRTSLPWPEDNQKGWPIKPDIVMEGGNYAEQADEVDHCQDLALLTTTIRPGGRLLETICDTSPASAAAARMAAIIWSRYPRLWPETIRGLMVHSAAWTQAMRDRFPGSGRAAVHRRLRCYGYGVPNLGRALWSAENAATLVFEGELTPYKKQDSEVRSNEMHVHSLPWPIEVLEDLGHQDVRMRVTLSYFVEPSPGRIGWTKKHRYQSHGLRFEVNQPTENERQFRGRLSRQEWDDPSVRPDAVPERRNWELGEWNRTRGSVHSDWWTGTAADLASCGLIAVYPVSGWWRERHHLRRFDRAARYSLLVTIEAPGVDVDLYSAIEVQARVRTEVERG